MSTSRVRTPEPFRKLAATARAASWTITQTRSGHLRWVQPDGKVIVTPSTPSCTRGTANARSRLRKAGLKEGPP